MRQVRVECIYEPPQETFPEGFEVADDPRGETADKLAELLGLKKARRMMGVAWLS